MNNIDGKGKWQRYIAWKLSRGEKVPADASHLVRGRAKMYLSRYQTSLDNLISSLIDQGFDIDYTPGPRGGRWRGYFVLKSEGGTK